MAMSSSPSKLSVPDNVSAAASNTFHVLNSGSGAWGHANAEPYMQSPQTAMLHSPAVTNYSYPAICAAPTNTVVPRSSTPSEELTPQKMQQLMILAGYRWGSTCPPLLQNYALMSPPLLPPSGPRGAPLLFAPGTSGAGGIAVGAGGGMYCPGESSGSADRRRPANLKPLQIPAPSTNAGAGAGAAKKVPPADGDKVDGAEQHLAPVLAMPTIDGAAANGRVRKSATKDKETKMSVKKQPQQRVAAKQRLVTNPVVAINDLQIASASPHPSNVRRRKNSVAAVPSSGRCNLVARRSNMGVAATRKKHTVLTWLIEGGFLGDKEKLFCIPEDDGMGKVIPGSVTRTGIHCSCCNTIVSLCVFQAHAGHDPRQQLWEKVLLTSGTTLLLCIKEAWEKERLMIFQAQEKVRAMLDQEKAKSSQAKRRLLAKQKGLMVETAVSSPKMKINAGEMDSSDDACGVCADGGELLCCDSCLSTFHPECLAMKVPEGSWICHYCRCMMCMANDDNGLSTCQQCTRKYHQHCRPLLNNIGGDGAAYCSETCKKLSAQLSDIIGVTNYTEDGFSWAVLKIQKDESFNSQGMPGVLQSNVKLAVALGVLNECFNPVKDRRTKIDMLHQAVYSLGSEFKRVSYEGFYTVVLEKDGEMISVALLRFHGTKLAEMPFAGTVPLYQRQGMMGRLLKGVEQLLVSLQVEKLLLPAIADRVETWTRSFSFRPVEPQLREEMKMLSLVMITGTTLLQKTMAKQQQQQQQTVGEEWWRKYTIAPIQSEHMARLTDDELAFLEMEQPVCSFTDLVTGKVSLLQQPCATNSAASMSPGSGGWPSWGEKAVTTTAMIHAQSKHLGDRPY